MDLSKKRAEAGRKGGIASAKSLNADQRSERATKGGVATIQKYGSAYFGYISTLQASGTRRKQ